MGGTPPTLDPPLSGVKRILPRCFTEIRFPRKRVQLVEYRNDSILHKHLRSNLSRINCIVLSLFRVSVCINELKLLLINARSFLSLII